MTLLDSANPPTIPRLFFEMAEACPDKTLLQVKVDGKFQPLSWGTVTKWVRDAGSGLLYLGVKPGDKVGILSENRPEWVVSDLAILSIQAVVVPIYPTASLEEIEHIIQNSGLKVLCISSQVQCERLRPVLEKVGLRHLVLFDPAPDFILPSSMRLLELVKAGQNFSLNNPEFFYSLVRKGKADVLATLIYTSGTTGLSKGVMLTHSNLIENYRGAQQKIRLEEGNVALSFLPLSHVFERLAGYYFMIFSGAEIAYAENMQTVVEDMQAVRPTVAAAVPRFYEKIYSKVLDTIENSPPPRKKLLKACLEIGKKYSPLLHDKAEVSLWHRFLYFLCDRVFFSKIKKIMGGRILFFISGGAALNPEIAEFFYAAGILILEGYGLSETSPVISVNSFTEKRIGTVGKPLVNSAVKIAEDGEILTQGPCVMLGYYQNEEATREVLKDGWFHTGDIGEFDSDGFLKITDRKKDIIKTSGGKIIAPQNVEKRILSNSLFSQAVVVGDKRNYVVALIVPNRERLTLQAKEWGIELPWEDLLKHPKVYSSIEQIVHEAIKDLATYEQIKYFALISQEFTQEAGEVTPTLKIKRRVVQERYKDVIDRLYTQVPNRSGAFL